MSDDNDSEWVRLKTKLTGDYAGRTVGEIMPRFAYNYLVKHNVRLQRDGGPGKRISAYFNTLKHKVMPLDIPRDPMDWFKEPHSSTDWWRVLLQKTLGLSIEDFLDEDDSSSDSSDEDDEEEADESSSTSSNEDDKSFGSDADYDTETKEKKEQETSKGVIFGLLENGDNKNKKRPWSLASIAPLFAEDSKEEEEKDEPAAKKRRILPWEKTAASTNTYIFAFMWKNVEQPFFVLQFRAKQEDENAFVECVRLILRAHLSPRKFYAVIRLWFGVGSLKENLNTCRSGAGDIFDAYQELQKIAAPATTIFSRSRSPPLGEKIQYLCYFGEDDDDEDDED